MNQSEEPEDYQKGLKEILNDKKILKLGVGIDGDLKRLINEGYVTPGNEFFLDLRFLAVLSEWLR